MSPRAVALLAALALLPGCADLGRVRRTVDRRVLMEWFTCIDCPPEVLNRVLAASLLAPDAVTAQLGTRLADGPDAAALADLDSASTLAFARLSALAGRASSVRWRPTALAAYLGTQRLLAERTWRKRAAIVLARIGTRAARDAIDAACPGLTDSVEIVTVASIRLAIDTARGPCSIKADSLGAGWRPPDVLPLVYP